MPAFRITEIGEGKAALIAVGSELKYGLISFVPSRRDFEPEIGLVYPKRQTAAMVAIAREMMRMPRLPEVFLWDENLVVNFTVQPASREFLRKLGKCMALGALGHVEEKARVIASAEIDGLDARAIERFTEFFGRKKYYILSIVNDIDRSKVLWRRKMTSFFPRSPYPLS